MATWRLQCRTHGGIFVMPSRKGRKPVRCSDEHMCLRHPNYNGSGNLTDSEPTSVTSDPAWQKAHYEAAQRNPGVKVSRSRRARSAPVVVATEESRTDKVAAAWEKRGRPTLSTKKKNLRTTVQKPAEVTVTVNRSLPPAQKAKEALAAKGWTVHGRAWKEEVYNSHRTEAMFAEVTATRDDERILMVWDDGELITQDYQLWHNDQLPEKNNRPKTSLDFDPEEISDKELIQRLAGQPVTWWNRLGTSEEHGIVGDRVRITHTFIGDRAEENTGERVITFVDHGGGGYRSFYVSALMKVG